ncbi:MAG: SMP-30/gluconolactonase/LRE family protein [Actinomycetota bacterium]|nr:SMP-30/gluconolactonase/LRE family protein [Actinomycetota bacterium]
MTARTAVRASSARFGFGEGLRWDAAGDRLLWVDLLAGRLHRAPLSDLDAVETLVQLDGPLGAVTPCSDGGWLLAAGRGLSHLAEDGRVRPLVELEPPGSRMNDAACDLQGRFWVGSTADDEREGAGSLYRVDLDGTVVGVRGEVTIGNGPAFSPDGGTLYLDDSGRRVLLAFDLDPATGELSRERELVRFADGAGDGLTVDDEGFLWVAVFGGGAVHRYDPGGQLVERVEVAASQVSSCCLAGGRLFATTVAERLSGPEPDAGHLVVADVGVSGPPVRPFRGRLPSAPPG